MRFERGVSGQEVGGVWDAAQAQRVVGQQVGGVPQPHAEGGPGPPAPPRGKVQIRRDVGGVRGSRGRRAVREGRAGGELRVGLWVKRGVDDARGEGEPGGPDGRGAGGRLVSKDFGDRVTPLALGPLGDFWDIYWGGIREHKRQKIKYIWKYTNP